MATVIGLKKAVQRIALDESEGSPVYTLDLTDKSISEKLFALVARFKEFQQLGEWLRSCEDDERAAWLLDKTAELYEQVISDLLGADAYKEIVEYVGGGEDASNLNMILTPLVRYLFEQVLGVVHANDEAAVGKYLESDASAAL